MGKSALSWEGWQKITEQRAAGPGLCLAESVGGSGVIISIILRKCFGSPGDLKHSRVTGTQEEENLRSLQSCPRALWWEGTTKPPRAYSTMGSCFAVWPLCSHSCCLLSSEPFPMKTAARTVFPTGALLAWGEGQVFVMRDCRIHIVKSSVALASGH